MKKIFLLLFLSLPGMINAQSWQWAKSSTCSGKINNTQVWGSEGFLLTNDNNNNIYAIGVDWGDSTCVGGFKIYNTNYQGYSQIFLAKYDTLGNVIWVKSSLGGDAVPLAVTTDENGNIYVYGCFTTDSIWFDTHLLVNPIFNNTQTWLNSCYFIIKYSSTGSVIWARNAQGNTTSSIGGDPPIGDIKVDGKGNVYICGSFSDSVLQIGAYKLADSFSGNDIFIAKYDLSGDVVWAKRFGGNSEDFGMRLAVSPDYSIYLTGNYQSTPISFGSTVFTNTIHTGGFSAAFILKLDSTGNVLWARNSVGNTQVRDITIDKKNDIYVGGGIQYSDTLITFGTFTYHSAYLSQAAFLAKYNANGDVIKLNVYCSVAGIGTGKNEIYRIAIDACNNIWLTGTIAHDMNGMTLNNSTILYAPYHANSPMFLVGYSETGTLLDYVSMYQDSDDDYGMATDRFGNIYLCNDFNGEFIIGSDTLYQYDSSGVNFFIAKYHPIVNCKLEVIETQKSIESISIFPNPTTSILTISAVDKITQISITNLLGQIVYSQEYDSEVAQINVSTLPPGVYFAKINGSVVRKFVKQ